MYSVKRIITLALVCILFFVFNSNTFSKNYDYPPVKRGTEEWKKLTPEEKLKVCQIPEKILVDLSTEELIQDYLAFPFIDLIAAYDDWQTGFDRIYKDFNGVRELLNRDDAGKKIISVYKNMNPEEFKPEWTSFEKGKFIVHFVYIETLFAQKEILKQLSEFETKEFLLEAINKFNKKQTQIELHGIFGLEFTVFAMGRLMQEKDHQIALEFSQNPDIVHFLNSAQVKDVNILDIIIEKSKEYCK